MIQWNHTHQRLDETEPAAWTIGEIVQDDHTWRCLWIVLAYRCDEIESFLHQLVDTIGQMFTVVASTIAFVCQILGAFVLSIAAVLAEANAHFFSWVLFSWMLELLEVHDWECDGLLVNFFSFSLLLFFPCCEIYNLLQLLDFSELHDYLQDKWQTKLDTEQHEEQINVHLRGF